MSHRSWAELEVTLCWDREEGRQVKSAVYPGQPQPSKGEVGTTIPTQVKDLVLLLKDTDKLLRTIRSSKWFITDWLLSAH